MNFQPETLGSDSEWLDIRYLVIFHLGTGLKVAETGIWDSGLVDPIWLNFSLHIHELFVLTVVFFKHGWVLWPKSDLDSQLPRNNNPPPTLSQPSESGFSISTLLSIPTPFSPFITSLLFLAIFSNPIEPGPTFLSSPFPVENRWIFHFCHQKMVHAVRTKRRFAAAARSARAGGGIPVS